MEETTEAAPFACLLLLLPHLRCLAVPWLLLVPLSSSLDLVALCEHQAQGLELERQQEHKGTQ